MSSRTVAPAEDSNEAHRAFDGDPLLPVDERHPESSQEKRGRMTGYCRRPALAGRRGFCFVTKYWGTARRKFSSPVRESPGMTLCCRCAGPRPVAPWRKIPDLDLRF
ncbi:unnamed protein product [Calypogeia fissa]